MTDNEPDREEIFRTWVIISLERIYDLLLIDLYHKLGQEEIENILEKHKNHKYLFPEPEGE